MKAFRAAVFFFLLMIAPAFFAQTSNTESAVPRKLLVSITYPKGYALSAEVRTRVSRSLLVALTQTEGLRIIEYTGEPPESRKQWEEEAVKSGADCWLSIVFDDNSAKPTLKLLSYDIALGKKRIDKAVSLSSPLSESGVTSAVWEETVSLVAEQYFAVDPAAIMSLVQEKATLTFNALPDTQIAGLPGNPVKTGPDGAAVVEVPVPATYSIKFTRQSFFPVEMDLYVDSSLVIPVPQESGSRLALDFTLSNNFFPGVAAIFFPVPNYIFLKVSVDSFLVGLAANENAAFYSLPLTVVGFQAGFFFLPEESVPRLYIALGAFLRIAHLEDDPFVIDGLAPGGGQLMFGAEIGPTPRHRFFLEYSAIRYFTDFPYLLQAALGGGDTPFGYVFSNSSAMSLFNLRFGFRWLL
jgi:hypothetical protein